jgi:hypothetical protein
LLTEDERAGYAALVDAAAAASGKPRR